MLAVAGSLALHIVVLFLLPVLQEAQREHLAAPPLTARLAKPKPADPVPQSIEPPAQAPQRLPAPRPVVTAKAAPQQAVVPPSPPAPIADVEPAKPAAEAGVERPASPAASPSGAAQPLAASGPDPGSIAQFRLELMDLARRYKKYPRIAQSNNWEGRVELRIAIGEGGALSALTVKKSAGRSVLDDEAQAMLRAAMSKATIPPALRGKAFVVEIPVDFSLKD